MPFAPGDRVHAAALGTGLIREVRNGGRYLVEIKGRSFVVSGSRLALVEPSQTTRRAKARVAETQASASVEPIVAASSSLDLHGKTSYEALEALNAFLNAALLSGHAEVRIIHGRGGGTLKAAVHAQLKKMRTIRGFELDPHNPGVTIVRL